MARNIWKDPSPYGTYEGERGNPEQWKSSFKFAWDGTTAEKILNEEKKEWLHFLEDLFEMHQMHLSFVIVLKLLFYTIPVSIRLYTYQNC